ncbi:MAG: hypothetical protein P8188_16650 [Gemmatimonadota bacterium]|jgi:hypothetical protein
MPRPSNRNVPLPAIVLLTAVLARSAPAQVPPPPVDTTGLAQGPFATMEMLYERTIFNVDVLRLQVDFDPGTASELSSLVTGREYDEALAEQVVEVALAAPDVLVRSRFLRDVSLDQFLDGMGDNLRNARDKGYLTADEESLISRETRAKYAVLAGRGIQEGEVMWYRIRGDSLHVALESNDGEVLVEDRPVGPERRLAVLGGYLAPDSDFREQLIRSLFTSQDR